MDDRFKLLMEFRWRDTKPHKEACSYCHGSGLVVDPKEDYGGGWNPPTMVCPDCHGHKLMTINENPPLPEDILEEMRRHLKHVIENRAHFTEQYDQRRAKEAALNSSSL